MLAVGTSLLYGTFARSYRNANISFNMSDHPFFCLQQQLKRKELLSNFVLGSFVIICLHIPIFVEIEK
jgi:hypothetical protein